MRVSFAVLQAVAVVQRAMRAADPAAVMAELGFGPLTLVARFPVSMSGAAHCCFIMGSMTMDNQPKLGCLCCRAHAHARAARHSQVPAYQQSI